VRARIAVAALLVVGATAIPVPHSAALPSALPGIAQIIAPTGDQIAFASNRNGSYDIFIMNADGSGLTQLTTDPASDETQPAWSPDGVRIAFVRDADIWVMNADGSNPIGLHTIDLGSEFDFSSSPAWSPDGGQIAYERDGAIWVMNADGSGQHPLITNGTNADPAWSPDGTQIGFSRAVEGGSDLWRYAVGGGSEVNLTNDTGAASDTEPAWTPDGSEVVFAKQTLPVDLAIGKTDTPDPVFTNRALSYSVTVSNESPGQADGVEVRDTLPEGVTFSSVTTDTGTCSAPVAPATRVVPCSLGSMSGHSTAAISIEVAAPATVPAGGTITNVAQVSQASPGDANFANNTASATTTVRVLVARPLRRAMDSPLDVSDARRLGSVGPSSPVAAAAALSGCSPPVFVANICLIGVSSSSLTNVTADSGSVQNADPSVAPDGSMIAFERTVCTFVPRALRTRGTLAAAVACAPGEFPVSGTHISLIGTDGSNRVDLPGAVGSSDVDPAWRPSGDLSITKSDAPDPVPVGGALSYTLQVANHGFTDATGVVVSDSLPPGVTLRSVTPSQGSCSGGSAVTCSLGTIAGGATATIVIAVTAPPTPGTITNTANVSARSPRETDLSNNVATATTTVIAADLSVSMSDDPDPVSIGGDLTYAIVVTNNSASPAAGVLLTDELPAGTTFKAATPPGICSGGPTLSCDLGTIPEGTATSVSLVVAAPSTSGVIENTVTATAASPPDPDASNNTATEDTTVVSADVSITKSDAPDPVLVGSLLTYTLEVENNGALDATDVVVKDSLPAHTTFDAATSTSGTCAGTQTVICALGSLASETSATVTIVVRVHGRSGTITNTATVETKSVDEISANNTASTTTRTGIPSLVLLPSVGPPGFVTIAIGSGFPRHTEITLRWDPGIGEVTVTTDRNGELRTQVLIFRGDIQGPRELTATGDGFEDVRAPFLVEPATIQPRNFASRA
jgi:uncharacterized repeat protein (TIGR01451 family)